MSLSQKEIEQLAAIIRAFVLDLQAGFVAADTTSVVLSDFSRVNALGFTRTQIAALINRYYNEGRFENIAPSNRNRNIPES